MSLLPFMMPVEDAGGGGYVAADAPVFDGGTARLYFSDSSGWSDSKVFSMSCWIYLPAGLATSYLWHTAASNAILRLTSAEQCRLVITGVMDEYNTTGMNLSTWYHLAYSLNTATGELNMYHNGVSVKPASPTINDVTIDWSRALFGIMGKADGAGSEANAYIQEFWFDPSQYIDFSDGPTLAKFASGGKPVGLGSDGSTPTSTAPPIYLNKEYSTFHQNAGTGSDFTSVDPLTDSTISPSD